MDNKTVRVICIVLMLLTSITNVITEYFQFIGDGALNYFSDFWNLNDLIRIILIWTYCFCRLNLFGNNP